MMNQSFCRLALSAFLGSALCLSLPAEADGPFQFFTLTPCRLVDTRGLPGPSGGPILQDQVLRLFPSDILLPHISTVNFAAGEKALANGAIVPLADQSVEPLDLSVFPRVLGSGTVHMVLDVTGYFQ
jgi:hypothetical protein